MKASGRQPGAPNARKSRCKKVTQVRSRIRNVTLTLRDTGLFLEPEDEEGLAADDDDIQHPWTATPLATALFCTRGRSGAGRSWGRFDGDQ